jgi:archaeal flagellin FlaB
MNTPKLMHGSSVVEERGITGLETAIVLIAFVVVSSVFAFAALSTGLFSSDQAKETIRAGLSEARGTLELRGAVIAEDTDTDGDIDKVYFQVANAAGGEPIDLTQGKTIVRYNDSSQSVIFDTSALFSVSAVGDADSDNLLEPGELYEISLLGMESNLATNLANSKTFSIEVIPPQGAVLFIERSTPVVVSKYNDLT